MHWLWRRNRRIGVAHRRRGDHPALDNQRRLDAEESGLPEHQIGEFADFDRTDEMADAMRDRRVDRVLGEVTLDAEVVIRPCLLYTSRCV